jgi:hypothetical protein
MAAIEAGPPPSAGSHYSARKSQALPKHSLFGCNLEIHSKEEELALKGHDMSALDAKRTQERWLKQNKYVPSLPENVKNQLPGMFILQ